MFAICGNFKTEATRLSFRQRSDQLNLLLFDFENFDTSVFAGEVQKLANYCARPDWRVDCMHLLHRSRQQFQLEDDTVKSS